ncbi:MAG: hypothetical protein FJ271_04005 [Planctomycetes bacterium]|nr:hypothetical protein [Planctomycetota bacterium]
MMLQRCLQRLRHTPATRPQGRRLRPAVEELENRLVPAAPFTAVLTSDHVDIGIAFEGGAFDLHIHDEETDTEFAPNEALLYVNAHARTPRPADAAFDFIGVGAGVQIWQLPHSPPNPEVLLLGLGTEEIAPGTFDDGQIKVQLKSMTAPTGGVFSLFRSTIGGPEVFMATADGISATDMITLLEDGHEDLNWVFTRRGRYEITFEASGVIGGQTFSSGDVTYFFDVDQPGLTPSTVSPIAKHGGNFMAGQAQYADVNGDGRDDLIFQTKDNRFLVSLSTGAAFGAPVQFFKHGGTFMAGQAQFADVNGDDNADLIFQTKDKRFLVSLSNGAAFGAPVQFFKHGGTFMAGQAQFADVNGDDNADLIFQTKDKRFLVSLSNGAAFGAPTQFFKHGGTFMAGQAQFVDIDNDGKDDLVFQTMDNRFLWSRSNGAAFTGATQIAKHGGSFMAGQARFAHLNSDNLIDLVFQTKNNAFLLSLGNGGVFDTPRKIFQHGGTFVPGQAQFADMNGDGLDDLFFQAHNNAFLLAFGGEPEFTPVV